MGGCISSPARSVGEGDRRATARAVEGVSRCTELSTSTISLRSTGEETRNASAFARGVGGRVRGEASAPKIMIVQNNSLLQGISQGIYKKRDQETKKPMISMPGSGGTLRSREFLRESGNEQVETLAFNGRPGFAAGPREIRRACSGGRRRR